MACVKHARFAIYGHPDLLMIAEPINGEDFVPYNDAIFVEQLEVKSVLAPGWRHTQVKRARREYMVSIFKSNHTKQLQQIVCG